MKKSLLALAAMGAFAGAAQAQSSVTVYGLLDMGYNAQNYRMNNATNTTGQQAAPGANVPQTLRGNNASFNGNGNESTSRIGFRGTEDLGGGMSAFFTVEVALIPASDTQLLSGAAASNRQTFLGLASKGLGRAAFGTQYTVLHDAAAATDPGQLNNVAGNVIYAGNRNANPSDFGGAAAGVAAANSAGNLYGWQSQAGYTVRQNNMLKINSEVFNGVKFNAFYNLNNSNQNQTGTNLAVSGGTTNTNGWGVGLDFSGVKNLFATATYQSFKNTSPYGVTQNADGTVTFTGGAPAVFPGAAGTAGTNVVDNQFYLAATYQFGNITAYAQYINRKATSNTGSYTYSRTGQQIGVRGFATKTIEGWASVGTGRYSNSILNAGDATPFTNAPTANLLGWQLGSNYWLSKRTNLYAIYGQQSTSNVTYPTNAAGANSMGPISFNSNQYTVGMRHTF